MRRIKHCHHVLRRHFRLDVVHRANNIASAGAEIKYSPTNLTVNFLRRAMRKDMMGVDCSPKGEPITKFGLKLFGVPHVGG